MPYNFSGQLQYGQPITSFIGARDNAAKNALFQQQAADQQATSEANRQNLLFQQQRQTAADQVAAQERSKASSQDEGKQIHAAMQALNAVAGDPVKFQGLSQRILNHPTLGPVLAKHGVTMEDMTPANVQELLSSTGAEIGQAPADTFEQVQGPRGSIIKKNTRTGDLAQVVGPDNSDPAAVRPQLVDVPMADGTVQKQWIYPGRTTGSPVGAPTTPKDSGPGGGGREATMFNRVLMSASQATKTLENIVKMPMSSSTGIFGNAHPGGGVMSSALGSLRNAMTTQEVQSYRPVIAGLTRSLAGIEAAGMMPSGTLTHQMDAVIFQEGDSQLTKLRKLAEARQIVEEGVKTYLENPRVAEGQKKQISGFIDRMEKAIPFTQDDVTALERSKDKNTTIQDVVRERLRAESQPAPSISNDVVKVATPADAAKLPSGTRFVTPDGQVRTRR